MSSASKARIEHDIDELLAVWERATARRAFAEAHFALDGWPRAEEISEAEAMDGAKWSRK
jgi:hypothetical protein